MKLPVSDVITGSFAFIWRDIRFLSMLIAPAVLVLAILSGIATWLSPVPNLEENFENISGDNLGLLLVLLILGLVNFVIYFLFSVAWHRRYLLPISSSTIGDAYRWRKRHWKFFVVAIKLMALVFVIWMAAIILGLVAAALPFLAIVAVVAVPIALIAIFIVVFRVGVAFPAAAVDQPMGLRDAYRLTKGNGLRILVATVVTSVIAGVIVGAISVGLSALVSFLGAEASLTVHFITALVNQFSALISIAVGVSVLSIIYQHIMAHPPTPQPLGADGE